MRTALIILGLVMLLGMGFGMWMGKQGAFFLSNRPDYYWVLPDEEKTAFIDFVKKTQKNQMFIFVVENGLEKTDYSMGFLGMEPAYYAKTLKFPWVRIVQIYVNDETIKEYKDTDQRGMLINLLLLQLKNNINISDDVLKNYTSHFYLTGWNFGIIKNDKQ